MKKGSFFSYVQITGAMVIVGSNIVAGKLISHGFPLFLASALRFALASLVLLALVLRVEKRFPRITLRDACTIALISFFGNFLYSIFLLYGLTLTSATESGIISGTSPVITAIFAYFFLRERLGRQKIAGLLLVILGIVILNLSGQAAISGTHSLLGDVLIGGSVIGEVIWTLLSKTLSPKLSPLVISALTTFCGFFFFLPFGIGQAIDFPLQTLPVSSWLVVAYYGVVGTVGAYLLWYRGVSKVPASTAGMFIGIMPVSTVILSYVLLKEPFQWTHLLGILCVLAALMCIAWDFSTHRRRSSSTPASAAVLPSREPNEQYMAAKE